MAAREVDNLVFIDGIMDKYMYLNISRRNLKASAQKLNLEGHYHLQQDNDPKHTAAIVRE